jgi:hypothetical protein
MKVRTVSILVGFVFLLIGFISFSLVLTSTKSQKVAHSHIPINELLTSSNGYSASWDLSPPGKYPGEYYTLEIGLAASNSTKAVVWEVTEQGTFRQLENFYVGVFTWSLEKSFGVSGENISFYHVEVEAQEEEQVQVYGDMYFYLTETQPVFDEPRIAELIATSGLLFSGLTIIVLKAMEPRGNDAKVQT